MNLYIFFFFFFFKKGLAMDVFVFTINYGLVCVLFVLSSGISLQHEAHSYEKVQHHQIYRMNII
jgi:hypothetical protein